MKRTKKSVISAALCVSLAITGLASMASCGESTSGKGVYTYNTFTTVSPSDWNELTYQDNNDRQIMSYIGSDFFEYDYKFDDNGNIISGAYDVKYAAVKKAEDVSAKYAEQFGYDATSTDLAWKLTFREDLKWDDGTPIKAEDFVYSMQQQLDPLFKNFRANSYYSGASTIVNAIYYFKQGWKGFEQVSAIYDTINAAKAAGYTLYLDKNAIDSGFSTWGLGSYDSAKKKGYLSYFDMFEIGEGGSPVLDKDKNPIVVDNFFTKYNVETAENNRIALTDEMMADYATCLRWNPNPQVEMAMLSSMEYTYPEFDFKNVGIFTGDTDYELVVVFAKPVSLFDEDGKLSYLAGYNLQNLPLVKKSLYEKCKKAPVTGSTLWTTNYNSSRETTASWGPYKLTYFQSGKQYVLEKNDKWYGYQLNENKDLYQTNKIVCNTMPEWNTAWQAFQKGQLNDISIDVSIASDYRGSERAIFTPDSFVSSLQLQSNAEALKSRGDKDGVNKMLLTYKDFRKAISLSIDRADYVAKCTTSSLAGFGLFNSMHYYDVANGKTYRNTDEAKKTLCNTYNVDYTKYDTLDDAVDAITGYDLKAARELVTKAYNEAKAAGDITDTDKVTFVLGTAEETISTRRNYEYFKQALTELMVGTPLEGRFTLDFDTSFGKKWATDFRAGAYDICTGGWTGAEFDPGYFLGAYLDPANMYSQSWDTSAEMLTISNLTMNGEPIVNKDGGRDITMSIMDWYDCLNANEGFKYNLSASGVPQSERLPIIAALENIVLTTYYSVPLANAFTAELLSYKVDYITTEYNTFMGYGGLKYMTYNYDDAAWSDYVRSKGGILNYK